MNNPPHSGGFCFQFLSSGRAWLFCATTQDERDSWLSVSENAIELLAFTALLRRRLLLIVDLLVARPRPKAAPPHARCLPDCPILSLRNLHRAPNPTTTTTTMFVVPSSVQKYYSRVSLRVQAAKRVVDNVEKSGTLVAALHCLTFVSSCRWRKCSCVAQRSVQAALWSRKTGRGVRLFVLSVHSSVHQMFPSEPSSVLQAAMSAAKNDTQRAIDLLLARYAHIVCVFYLKLFFVVVVNNNDSTLSNDRNSTPVHDARRPSDRMLATLHRTTHRSTFVSTPLQQRAVCRQRRSRSVAHLSSSLAVGRRGLGGHGSGGARREAKAANHVG